MCDLYVCIFCVYVCQGSTPHLLSIGGSFWRGGSGIFVGLTPGILDCAALGCEGGVGVWGWCEGGCV